MTHPLHRAGITLALLLSAIPGTAGATASETASSPWPAGRAAGTPTSGRRWRRTCSWRPATRRARRPGSMRPNRRAALSTRVPRANSSPRSRRLVGSPDRVEQVGDGTPELDDTGHDDRPHAHAVPRRSGRSRVPRRRCCGRASPRCAGPCRPWAGPCRGTFRRSGRGFSGAGTRPTASRGCTAQAATTTAS